MSGGCCACLTQPATSGECVAAFRPSSPLRSLKASFRRDGHLGNDFEDHGDKVNLLERLQALHFYSYYGLICLDQKQMTPIMSYFA